jgi:RimJ/RimL family protein N-acetyltransferase
MDTERESNTPQEDVAGLLEIRSPDGEITLTQYILQDAKEIFELIDNSREHLSQHQEDTAIKYPTLDVLRKSIAQPENPARLRLAIRNREGHIVGGINLTPDKDNPRFAEIGYWQGIEFSGRRKGYVGRAVQALTQFSFDNMNLDTIYGDVFETNISSMNVLRRAGYQEAGKDDKGYIRFIKKKQD